MVRKGVAAFVVVVWLLVLGAGISAGADFSAVREVVKTGAGSVPGKAVETTGQTQLEESDCFPQLQTPGEHPITVSASRHLRNKGFFTPAVPIYQLYLALLI